MCFHTSQTKKVTELENRYKVTLTDTHLRPEFDKPRYHLNGFAHPGMLIIPQENAQALAPAIWGIVPDSKDASQIGAYYKEAVRYGGGLNARAEKLFDHFIYKGSVLTKRCIIPVTGFFEPHEYGRKKYPFYISGKEDVLSLAGIYTVIDHLVTFAILTKEASPFFAKIHNKKQRQPVLLTPETEREWLKNGLDQKAVSEIIRQTYPDQALQAYTVSRDLFKTNVDTNIPSILKKVDYGTELYGFFNGG